MGHDDRSGILPYDVLVAGRESHQNSRRKWYSAMMKAANMLRGTTSNFGTPLVAHMMTPGVVQIPGDVSVSEAAILMDRERIPCLLVKDNDARYGIMTPADIVKKVIAQGLEPQDVEVRSLMSQPVHSIEYDQATDEAKSARGNPDGTRPRPGSETLRNIHRRHASGDGRRRRRGKACRHY